MNIKRNGTLLATVLVAGVLAASSAHATLVVVNPVASGVDSAGSLGTISSIPELELVVTASAEVIVGTTIANGNPAIANSKWTLTGPGGLDETFTNVHNAGSWYSGFDQTLTAGTYFFTYSGVGGTNKAAYSLNAVPETSTWAMMALGFAGLGFAGYRGARRKRESFAG